MCQRIAGATLPSGESCFHGAPPLKVLVALNAFERDGPGLLVAGLCSRWIATHGVEIDVVALSRDGSLRTMLDQAGANTVFLPSRGLAGAARVRDWMRERMSTAARPDIVHTNLLWPDLAFRLARKAFCDAPLVSTCHGRNLWWEKPLLPASAYTVAERLTRSRCSAWVAVSDHAREDLIRSGHDGRKIAVIRNGVDVSRVRPVAPAVRASIRRRFGVAADAELVVAAGTLRKLKGHDVLLEAMARLQSSHPRARCLIFGEGPDREPLLVLRDRLGLAGYVELPGSLKTMLPRVVAAADVFVQPSRRESYGLAVAEAQAAGVPAVASRVGGLPEVVRDGETGLLVPPDDPETLARGIARILDDEVLRGRMGAGARKWAVAEHDMERTASSYVEFWREVMAGRFPRS